MNERTNYKATKDTANRTDYGGGEVGDVAIVVGGPEDDVADEHDEGTVPCCDCEAQAKEESSPSSNSV